MTCTSIPGRAPLVALALTWLLAVSLVYAQHPPLPPQPPKPAAPAAPGQPAHAGARDEGALVTLEGCLVGSSLKVTRRQPGTVAGTLTRSDFYRLRGSRAIREQIEQAHAALVKVTGRLKPGPRAMIWGKRVGRGIVGVGTTQGVSEPADQRAVATPVIDVDAIEVIDETCE